MLALTLIILRLLISQKVKNIFKNTSIEIKKQIHDKRSYKLIFLSITSLKGKYKHQSIEKSILQLKKTLKICVKKTIKLISVNL